MRKLKNGKCLKIARKIMWKWQVRYYKYWEQRSSLPKGNNGEKEKGSWSIIMLINRSKVKL